MSEISNILIIPKKIYEFKFIYFFGIIISVLLSLYHHKNIDKKYDVFVEYTQIIESSIIENELKRHFKGLAKIDTSTEEIIFKNLTSNQANQIQSELLKLNDVVTPKIEKIARLYLNASISSLEYFQNLEYDRIKKTITILEERSQNKEQEFDDDFSKNLGLGTEIIPWQLYENDTFEQIFLILNIIEKNSDFYTIGELKKNLVQSSQVVNISIFYILISLLISSLVVLIIELRKKII